MPKIVRVSIPGYAMASLDINPSDAAFSKIRIVPAIEDTTAAKIRTNSFIRPAFENTIGRYRVDSSKVPGSSRSFIRFTGGFDGCLMRGALHLTRDHELPARGRRTVFQDGEQGWNYSGACREACKSASAARFCEVAAGYEYAGVGFA